LGNKIEGKGWSLLERKGMGKETADKKWKTRGQEIRIGLKLKKSPRGERKEKLEVEGHKARQKKSNEKDLL